MYVQYLNTTQCHRPIVVVTGGFVHCNGSSVIRTVYKLALHRAQARPWPASNKSAHCQGLDGAWQRALGLPGHARWWAGRRCAVALSGPQCCLGTVAATWQMPSRNGEFRDADPGKALEAPTRTKTDIGAQGRCHLPTLGHVCLGADPW